MLEAFSKLREEAVAPKVTPREDWIAYEGVVRTTAGSWVKDLQSNWAQEPESNWTLYQGVAREKVEKESPYPKPYWGPPPKVPQEPKKVKRLIPLKLRVDRGKNRRYYLIRKNDQARYMYPLTPHKKGEN